MAELSQVEDIQYGSLTLNFDLDFWKDSRKVWHRWQTSENRTFTFQQITASIANKQTNEQTDRFTWSQYLPMEVTNKHSILFVNAKN